jgi:hypothetical protein
VRAGRAGRTPPHEPTAGEAQVLRARLDVMGSFAARGLAVLAVTP